MATGVPAAGFSSARFEHDVVRWLENRASPEERDKVQGFLALLRSRLPEQPVQPATTCASEQHRQSHAAAGRPDAWSYYATSSAKRAAR